MIVLFKKSQGHLFDAPVHVAPHVRKDGVVVGAHTRIQKVRAKQPHAVPRHAQPDLFGGEAPAKKPGRLEAWIAKHGGLRGLARTLSTMSEGQQQQIFDAMSKLGGKTPTEVSAMFDGLAEMKPEKGETDDLFASPAAADQEPIKDEAPSENSAAEAAPAGADQEPVKKKRAPRRKKAAPAPAAEAPAPAPEPLPATSHDRDAPFGVPAGTSKARRREINSEVAIMVADGQVDRPLFEQYSGNGGCGDSLNEYYTDPAVARAMWDTLTRLGAEHGTALEPSCGTGVFLHTAPAGFRVTGVELDPTSAAVASALHGDRHEVNTASLERFATADDRQFDVVIGNPPYGPRGFLAKDDKVGISTAEDYFVDTAIDKTKPGGLIALVVPTGVMDSSARRSLRHSWLKRAQFLGALRMPNTAFEHSHTEVTTDVVFLRKRPDDVAGALATVDSKSGQETLKQLGVWDEEFLAGSYFEGRGAGNVLGTMEAGWRAKAGIGNDITVSGSMEGVPAAIAEFTPDPESVAPGDLTIHQVLDALPDQDAKDRALSAATRRPYANTAKVGDTKTVDGVSYVLQGDPPRWHRVDEFMATGAVAAAQPLAQRIQAAMDGGDHEGLADAVRAYVAEHGIPADNPELMTAASVDKTLYRMVGAVNRKGELSDTVLGRSRRVEGSFEAQAEAMALDERGSFTPAELAERVGRDVESVEDQLVADARYAYLGDGQWTTTSAYLTGELWPKLDAARAALAAGAGELQGKLEQQAKRLEDTIAPRSLDEVEVQLNSAFLPLHVLEAYFNWRQFDSEQANEWTRKQPPVEIKFAEGVYTITGGNQYASDGTRLMDKYLNRTGVKKDEKPTIDRMNSEFKEWLCGSQYRDAVEELYNRKFRGFVSQDFSDAPIDVPGLATDRDVRSWRWSSLRRSLALGKGIVADDVGLGKTLGGLLLARMAKMDGRAKRPIIVVPKSVLANWYSESQTWFPGSRVLTIGATFSEGNDGELVGKDDSAAERKRKYHDLTQNDYDFIIVSEPAFEEVDLSPDLKEGYYSDDFWVQRGDKLGNAGDKRRKRIKEQYEQAVASREFQDRTDAIYFDQLGVDMLLADEMHHQKNLYAAKARFGDQPKFLGGQGLSNRALDFNLKTRWIREKNGGKGIFGLTATPTKNSPLEIYSMLSHVAPEAFERIGIRNSEEFLDRFCEFTNDKVLSTSGEIEDATVVSGFKNLNELREIMARFIDRRTAEQVGLQLPERSDRMHLVDMTPKQQEVYAELRELAEKAKEKDATGDAHIFSIMDRMNKAALDLQLVGPEHAGARSPKYDAIAGQVKDGLKEGAQIIFSEYIDTHDRMVAALVDSGVPRERIGVINAKVAGSAVKRQNIAEALNNGKLDVVIGNATMAEGLNMQKRTTDIHHADVPWEPATLQQRNGRGLRQGNLNERIRIHTYLSKGSFDGYRYQAVSAKKDWQDLLWNGGDRVENLAREGQFNREDMRIMLAADPEAARAAYAADKAAAEQRYASGQRVAANEEFVRFQEMTRSYSSLKNKGTISAARLKSKLEGTKTSLFNNKFFPAKHALDSATDVLIEPQTGVALHAGAGIDVAAGSNVAGVEKPDGGRYVVVGVNVRDRRVKIRPYGDVDSRTRDVPLDGLSTGITPFTPDKDAEAAEIRVKLETAAAGKLNSITSWKDVQSMPSSVLEANHDLIQQQIKSGSKDYSFRDLPHTVPMVDKQTGAIKMAESYEHNRLHDTHDYLLPTESSKEKAIQAWIDARRRAKVSSEYVHIGKGRSQKSTRKAAREYEGASYGSRSRNPVASLLDQMSPGQRSYGVDSALVKEAKQRLQAEQMQRIRRADSLEKIVDELVPLAKPEGSEHGMLARYPKEALSLAWARARHLGALDKLMPRGKHGHYAVGQAMDYGRDERAAHDALVSLAAAAGHHDLAEAMVASAERHAKHVNTPATASVLTEHYTPGTRRLRQVRAIAERHGLADKTLGELRSHGLGGNFKAADNYMRHYAGTSGSVKFMDKWNELYAHAQRTEAEKEAA